jgi:membrane-associated protein
LTGYIQDYGLWLLFIVIALESAGIPLPGETALIAAGVLAAKGHLNIVEVIAVAALAAIVGDNCGYAIGRHFGRRLLEVTEIRRPGRWPAFLWPSRTGEDGTRTSRPIPVWGPIRRFIDHSLPPAERFFARHGQKTVFIARFIAGLRVTAAWMAGISRMHWWRFFMWNAAGGIAWATVVGLVAYYFGRAVADAIAKYGLIGAAVAIGIAAFVFVVFHFWKRRRWEAEEERS